MRRDTLVAAVIAALLASLITLAMAWAQDQQPSADDTPIAEPTEQIAAAPDEKHAKTVQQKMLAQLRAIDAELHVLNHRTYIVNHNIVVAARGSQLTAARMRILNQNLFVDPTTEKFGPLSKNGYLGRIAQAVWAMCDEQAVHDSQYGYCSENVYVPPPPGR